MTMSQSPEQTATTLADRITAVERAYEYMIAYAAQGRRGDTEGNVISPIREMLEAASEALDSFTRAAPQDLAADAAAAAKLAGFVKVLQEDARKARAMVGVVLAQPSISSQMIDNLNASIHLRTLMTDLFVVSAAGKTAAPAA
jgi:hypothetical protein